MSDLPSRAIIKHELIVCATSLPIADIAHAYASGRLVDREAIDGPRFYIVKHPEDGLPFIDQPDPDPRSGSKWFDDDLDAPNYSGWYVRLDAALTGVDV